MKHTLFIFFAIFLTTNAMAQPDRSGILDKIRTGATQFQNDPAVRNSAPVVLEVVDENGRREQRVTPHIWTRFAWQFSNVYYPQIYCITRIKECNTLA